jgi:hypothetical protein
MSIRSVAEFLHVNEDDGFVVTPVQFDAGTQFDAHAHDFASRILITEGTLWITTLCMSCLKTRFIAKSWGTKVFVTFPPAPEFKEGRQALEPSYEVRQSQHS